MSVESCAVTVETTRFPLESTSNLWKLGNGERDLVQDKAVGTALTINLIGELQVLCDGTPVTLPPSRKTRALFAYLAATGESYRRERLCEMFWDIPDDPKGALRWSLSKIRGVLGKAEKARLRADRDTVRLDTAGLDTDIATVRTVRDDAIPSLDETRLEALAGLFRGEFLEGLDLPNAHTFHAWCQAERETMRTRRKSVLSALLARLSGDPARALPYARRLVDIDPLDESLRAQLIRLLVAAGRTGEAAAVYQSGITLAEDFDVPVSGTLAAAGWQIESTPVRSVASVPSPAAAPAPPSFVGRDEPWTALHDALGAAAAGTRVLLVHGEPGIGKTRLFDEFLSAVMSRGGRAIKGTAIESRWGQPYAPWIEALSEIPSGGATLTVVADLSDVLVNICGERFEGQGRHGLFDGVARAVADWAAGPGATVLALDDVHWLDEASVELLHYIVHANARSPILILLGGRGGELHDNEPLQDAIRSFRHEARLDEIELAPLAASAVADLAGAVASGVDVGQVLAASGGNPLMAMEIARALSHGQIAESRSLADLIHDRIDGLPDETADVLRWCSVIGEQVDLETMERVLPHTPDQTALAIEMLERHGILRAVADPAGRPAYRFAHSVFRQFTYVDMSEPRRRLMHRHIAQALSADIDNAGAAATAFHASLAGDGAMAARACVAAGRNCLRQFANGEAEQLARRGLHYVEDLHGAERVKLAIELMEISLAAKRPDDPDHVAQLLCDLANEALDLGCPEHARLGYHLLSYLRWNQGDWSEAHFQMTQARAAGHAGDSLTNALSLAEMSRCLVLLDRDIPQADAMLMEADKLAGQAGRESHVFGLARGMLLSLRGEWDEAAAELNRARVLARAAGERVDEYEALEILSVIALRGGRSVDAQIFCRDLVALSEKIREGSEQPCARALKALADWSAGDDTAQGRLETHLAALRGADAKHRLAVALTLTAREYTRRGDTQTAQVRAREALDLAIALNRPSDEVFARVAIARAALAAGDAATAYAEVDAVSQNTTDRMCVPARNSLERVRKDLDGTRQGSE